MATYPEFLAGQTLTAAALRAMLEDYVYVAGEQSVSNSTTLVNDGELTYALAANAIYEAEFYVSFKTAVNCDLKSAWSTPAGAAGTRKVLMATGTAGSFTSRTNTAMRTANHAHTTVVSSQLDTGSLGQAVWERGIVETTSAGDLIYQWAQDAAVVGNLTRETNSYLKIRRIG